MTSTALGFLRPASGPACALSHATAGLAFLALAACATAGDLCDDLRQEVLEQSTERTVVSLQWPDLDRAPASASFTVALPGPTVPRVTVLERVDFTPRAASSVETALPEAALQVDPPRRFRHLWQTTVTVDPWQRDGDTIHRIRSIILEVSHPFGKGAPPALDDREPTAAYEGFCLNPRAAEVFLAQAASTTDKSAPPPTDTFAASPNWIRVEIDQTGVHAITFENLVDALLSRSRAEMIDPQSLRLFSASHVRQPVRPEDKEGSWKRDYGLVERSLIVEADGPTLQSGDRTVFFAAGPEAWLDRHEPAAEVFDHVEHEYADRLAYWLTWDELGQSAGQFPQPPLRMTSVSGAITGDATQTRDHRRARVHAEENLVELYGAVEDNWVWERRVEVDVHRTFPFTVTDLLEGSLNTFRTHGRARERRFDVVVPARMRISFNDQAPAATFQWQFSQQHSVALAPLEFTTSGFVLREGENDLVVENLGEANQDGIADEIMLDFFDVTYDGALTAHGGRATWLVFGDEVTADATWEFQVASDATWSSPYVLRTDDPLHPVRILDADLAGSTLRLQAPLVTGENAHFDVVEESALLSPARVVNHRPRLLRAEVYDGVDQGYDMVILHPANMASAAEDLRDHRAVHLDGHPNARVTAVDLQDVYDQFGFGVKEPAAIRNYLKFLFLVDPRLEFVVLLGDASRDVRNRAGRDPLGPEIDRCPSFVQTHWPLDQTALGSVPYARDDWLVSFDDPPLVTDNTVNIDLPDLAIGRLPAGSAGEAAQLVRRTIDYETRPPGGVWRNRALLVADDEFAAINPTLLEPVHVEETECIADFLLPPEIDVDKLYLTEYPRFPGVAGKPRAREDMRRGWSDGALIVHYVGHGSPEQLADEAVFRIEDVPALENGRRLPLFLALSCDVAIFDDPVSKSMTEQLVLDDRGGAVAGIAATQVTYSSPNENLTEAFYPLLYPPTRPGPSAPLGRALTVAKSSVPFINSTFTRHNDAKYVLLGDPALQLQSPSRTVSLRGDLATAIRTAQLQTLEGESSQGGSLAGRYYLEAKESADSTRFVLERPNQTTFVLPYVLPGSSFFSGTGTFEGIATAQVLTPAAMRLGTAGRVRLLLEAGNDMYVGLAAPLPVLRESFERDDDQGPTLSLAFRNDARQVTPGSVLTARLSDESGINVLGRSPASTIQLEFDDSGFPVDATPLFRLDDNTFTSGSLEYELPSTISPGAHRVVLRASDMLDNLSSAGLQFTVIAEGGLQIANHAVYPNPFLDTTRFVVEITADIPSTIEIDVYTTDGRRIRTLRRDVEQGGAEVLPWDGRDNRGDVIANGVYLYVVRATFGTDPPISERATGRVVRMR